MPCLMDTSGYGVDALTTSPEQMTAMIKGEVPVYTEAVKAAGLTKPIN